MTHIFVLLVLAFLLFFNRIAADSPGPETVKTAGLKEFARITDESGDFAFKGPRSIKIAPDGSMFVNDSGNLFQFTKEGKFVRNLIKRGEGPGEVKQFSDFMFIGDEVAVGAFMPAKIVFIGLDGVYKREFPLSPAKPFTILIHAAGDRFYFREDNITAQDLKNGENRRENTIIYCDPGGEIHKTELAFTTLDAVIKKSVEGRTLLAMDEITSLLTAFDPSRNLLYAVHKERYEIIRADLKSHRILGKIIRPYDPVPYTEKPSGDELDSEIEKVKNRKFHKDIWALRIYQGKLLVITSTIDRKRGVLVDVFDSRGDCVDKFFLKVPGVEQPGDLKRKPLCFHDGFFWTTSMDEEDNPFIIQYKIDY